MKVREDKRWIKGMRDSFFDSLFRVAKRNKDLILISADTGAICLDNFKKYLKRQYINIGIAEQNMIGIAAGLALSGKKVYVYAIIPFVTMRCYEQIRVDLCCMNLDVTVVGIGAGFDYSTLGPTHHGTEDIALMRVLPGMRIYSPSDSLMAELVAERTADIGGPKYIRLDRTGFPLVYQNKKEINFKTGFNILKRGKDLYIISTGRMVLTALNVAESLSGDSISVGVIDLFRIKPLERKKLIKEIKKVKNIVTLEEHFVNGGLGEIISRLLCEYGYQGDFKAVGIRDEFCRKYGQREYLLKYNLLDFESITEFIIKFLKKKGG